jgi:hypothetical protein
MRVSLFHNTVHAICFTVQSREIVKYEFSFASEENSRGTQIELSREAERMRAPCQRTVHALNWNGQGTESSLLKCMTYEYCACSKESASR